MNKEKIKFYIDNLDEIIEEIETNILKKVSSEEIKILENAKTVSEGIDSFFNLILKYDAKILEKYELDKDALKVIMKVFIKKELRDELFGYEEGNKLLRDIIDIYGSGAYEILECNDRSMYDIEGILSGEPVQQYNEFYNEVLHKKARKCRFT